VIAGVAVTLASRTPLVEAKATDNLGRRKKTIKTLDQVYGFVTNPSF